jgi:hypothetical protein
MDIQYKQDYLTVFGKVIDYAFRYVQNHRGGSG